MRLDQAFSTHYLPSNLKIRSELTCHHYRRTLRGFSEYLGRPATLADLTDANAAGYARWLLPGRAIPSVNQRLSKLIALWTWLAKTGRVKRFPTVSKLTEPETIPRAWTLEQISRLLEACRATPGKIGSVDASIHWEAIHRFWWDTGERTGATLAVRWEMLDLETGVIEVPAEIRKGDKGMVYSLKPETLVVLRKLFDQSSSPRIFHFPGHRASFYNHYARLLKRAGLPSGRRDKPQKMRRSFASHLKARGGNPTEALGHSDARVTQKSYLDPSITEGEPPNRRLPGI